VLFILDPTEEAQAAIGKRLTVVDYPDVRLSTRHRGAPLSDLCDARQLRQSSDDVAAWRYHRDWHSAGRRHGEEAEAHLSDARGRRDAGNREIMHTTFRKGCRSHEAYHHRLAKKSTRPNETAAILPFWRNWKIVEVLWIGGPLSHRFQALR
jgi:hypothetical protein